MVSEIRDQSEANNWFYAGLWLKRVETDSPENIACILPWLRSYLSQMILMPPVGVIADIGFLLTGSHLEFTPLKIDNLELKKAIQSYEDDFLGRLIADRHFTAVTDALARLDTEYQHEAVAFIVENLLARIGFSRSVTINPAIPRAIIQLPVDEILQEELAVINQLENDEINVHRLVEAYSQLSKKARHTGAMLTDNDVLTIENLPLLRNMSQRTMFKQVIDAAEKIELSMPKRMRHHSSREGRTTTKIQDDSAYPTGGFSSISNSGVFENLVSSELIYMEDSDQFDLFDVRYTEGDLLYYARDDSVFFRTQRNYWFILHSNLHNARVKDIELPWQRLIIVMGSLVCLIRKLVDWLSDDTLAFKVVFINDKNTTTPYSEELNLCQLFFREWIEQGVMEIISTQQSINEEDHEDDLFVHFCSQIPAQLDSQTAIVFDVQNQHPALSIFGKSNQLILGDSKLWPSWTGSVRNLLQQLV